MKEKVFFSLGVCAFFIASVLIIMIVGRVFYSADSAENNAAIGTETPAVVPPEAGESAGVFYAYEAENLEDYVIINRVSYHKNSTTLDLSDMNLSCEDIIPLKYMINLIELNLWGYNRVADLSPIAELTQLEVLQIGGNPVVDITPLTNLVNLEELRASGCNIIDLTPLTNLTKMRHLTLRENNISDISPLENLKELTTLRLNDNTITDWSPVAHVASVDGRPTDWEG